VSSNPRTQKKEEKMGKRKPDMVTISVIPVLKRQRQYDLKFKACLGYIAPFSKEKKKKKPGASGSCL
jgi:hypothetical protein